MNERDRELAREAGIKMSHDDTLALGYLDNAHRKFADLIRADERERLLEAVSIALLGVDKAVGDRVQRAIRARGDK